jgi:peptide deformylase
MQIKVVTNIAKLRKACKPVTAEVDVNPVARALLNYMCADKKCAGLAANQLGFNIRVICVPVNHVLRVLINPEITYRSDIIVEFQEGCESLPGVKVKVVRSWCVIVKVLNPGGPAEYSLEGLEARIVQHEVDHLDGILIIDKGPK